MAKPKIKLSIPTKPNVVPDKPISDSSVSISLKYWHSRSQCISEWQKSELTKLRSFVEKVQQLTPSELRTDSGLGWKPHKGDAAAGFARPKGLSREVDLCELRVDKKSRVHGALLDTTFFLVWLDRSHAVFPER
jgi:hypothetical protein